MVEAPKRCFVISAIGDIGSKERRHADMTLNAIIRPALAAGKTAFDVARGDESPESGMITDQIITAILESDLVIADLSFLNANVFYELGIAHAVEKPVIHIAHRDTAIPFDNIGYRAIKFDPTEWQSHIEAQKQITEAARIAVTKGDPVSNPITQARGWQKLKGSADSQQTVLARVVEEISVLNMKLSSLEKRVMRSSDKSEYHSHVDSPAQPEPDIGFLIRRGISVPPNI